MRNFLTLLWSHLVFGQTLSAPVFNDNQFLFINHGDTSGNNDYRTILTGSSFVNSLSTPVADISGNPAIS